MEDKTFVFGNVKIVVKEQENNDVKLRNWEEFSRVIRSKVKSRKSKPNNKV